MFLVMSIIFIPNLIDNELVNKTQILDERHLRIAANQCAPKLGVGPFRGQWTAHE